MKLYRIASIVLMSVLVSAVSAKDAKDTKDAKDKAKDTATTAPAKVIAVGDKAAIDAAVGSQASVEGTISQAAWSSSGKVFIMKFEGAEESEFSAVFFQRDKDKMDKAFGGDAAKTLTGAKVRVTGKVEQFRDKPQIVVKKAEQVVIEQPAAAQPG